MGNLATAPLAETETSLRTPVIFVVIGTFALLSLTCAVLSDGFVTADSCTHFLYAKYAFADPVNLVDVWARPFCTLLYAGPAHFGGRLGVRVMSIVVSTACGTVAGMLAKNQGLRWPSLAVILTLGGPLFLLFSYSEMTEIPFALLLGLALLAYQSRRYFLMSLLAGLLPTARPEGFGFVALAVVGLAWHRKWTPLFLLPLPLLTWDLAGWMLLGKTGHWWMWLFHAWPWSRQSTYGRGNGLVFVAALPIVVSPLVLPATFIGIWQSLRRRNSAIVALIPLGVLALHAMLRWSGIFGSLGEARYLLVAAPLWGVLSARGWELVFLRLHWKRVRAWAIAAVCFPIAVNAVYPIVPVHLTADWLVARRFAQFYWNSRLHDDYHIVIASHPGVYYFLQVDPNSFGGQYGFVRSVIQHPPANSILLWDPIFSTRNANLDDTATLDLIRKSGWIEDKDFSVLKSNEWHVFRSRSSPLPLRLPRPGGGSSGGG